MILFSRSESKFREIIVIKLDPITTTWSMTHASTWTLRGTSNFRIQTLAALYTRDWEPVTSTFKHSHWWKRWSWSKFTSYYAWGTNGVSMWMQDGCDVYVDSYKASNGSCFMVTWTIFKTHFLDTIHWSLTRSVKRSWTKSVFSSNESAWREMATGLQSRVRSGPQDGLWTLSFGLSLFHGRGQWTGRSDM